ncbi:hypothetical protein BASA81_015695 [Batrachochytrium salamandrivorans]|nr:hypothetical protein BASA81_015695 [Batrachochytrium salamandrivorans]
MEENSEFIARNLEEVGQARSAANVRTKAQAEAMRKRNGFDENTRIITSKLAICNFPRPLTLNTIPNPRSPDIMASLEDIVASLTDPLRSLELENQTLQQGIRPENIRDPKPHSPTSSTAPADISADL